MGSQYKITTDTDKNINKPDSEMVRFDWQRYIAVELVTDANNLQDN